MPAKIIMDKSNMGVYLDKLPRVWRSTLAKSAVAMVAEVQKTFDTEGYGAWPKNKPPTIKTKGHDQVLQETGYLRDTVRAIPIFTPNDMPMPPQLLGLEAGSTAFIRNEFGVDQVKVPRVRTIGGAHFGGGFGPSTWLVGWPHEPHIPDLHGHEVPPLDVLATWHELGLYGRPQRSIIGTTMAAGGAHRIFDQALFEIRVSLLAGRAVGGKRSAGKTYGTVSMDRRARKLRMGTKPRSMSHGFFNAKAKVASRGAPPRAPRPPPAPKAPPSPPPGMSVADFNRAARDISRGKR